MQYNNKIIGTFEGKCCDADIYNNNDMLLSKDLFNKLVHSEEYKRAMDNRYYIGFLGHPDDPNCMDFKDACIVMTDMQMHDNGEITGTFDLIDTPVGRIVKAFIDAGVTFGISIRGAGDIDASGIVDPETFVFRGFDLVTFPAYDDAVPVFHEIAASSDINKQAKYRKVRTAIRRNLSKITSCETLEILQSQLNETSPEYQLIENKLDSLTPLEVTAENCSLLQQKVNALMQLYVDAVKENQKLFDENRRLRSQVTSVSAKSERKIKSLKRITSSQIADLQRNLEITENRYKTVVKANSRLKLQNQEYVATCNRLESQLKVAKERSRTLHAENRQFESITANSKRDYNELQRELRSTRSQMKQAEHSNLLYQKKIESANQMIEEKDIAISKLKSQLQETVTANKKLNNDTLNRDDEARSLRKQSDSLKNQVKSLENETNSLKKEINSCYQLISDYQQSYADMCANAVGISVEDIPINGNTSPETLRKYIFGSTSTSSVPAKPDYNTSEPMEILDQNYEDAYDNDDYDDFRLTTL